MRFETTTAATFDAITLTDARLQVREPSNITIEDGLILSYIKSAGQTLEGKTNRVIGTSTFVGWLDNWPLNDYGDSMITINKNPVTAITSVEYYNEANILTTLASSTYSVDTVGKPARIWLTSTPDIKERVNAIKITFVAGYASPSVIDERIKQYVRMVVKDYKQFRTDYVVGKMISNLPRSAQDLLNQLVIKEF